MLSKTERKCGVCDDGLIGDDPLGRLDRSVLVRLSLRKFIEDCLRQFALFDVEHAIISEQEPAARLPVGLGTSSLGVVDVVDQCSEIISQTARTWRTRR